MGWFDKYLNPGGRNQDEGNGWPGQPVPPAGPPVTPPEAPGPNPNAGSGASAAATAVSQPYTPPGAWNPGAALPGWDQTKWNDQNKQNEKYKVGRILSKYPPTVDGLKQAWPEIKAAYPDATFDGKDGIVIPALGAKKIDVLRGASSGGNGWQWLDNNVEEAAGPNQGYQGNLGVQPLPGTGPGPVPSGGGYSGGDSGWTMPKGSEYQFGGIPGYSGGYQSGAFGMPTPPGYQADPMGAAGSVVPGRIPPSPSGLMTPDQPYQAGAFGLGNTSTSPDGVMTKNPLTGTGGFGAPGSADGRMTSDSQKGTLGTFAAPQSADGKMTPNGADATGSTGANTITGRIPGSPGGQFGAGMMTTDSGHGGDRTTAPPGVGTTAPPKTGYDRAPSFTPLDPFRAPPVPDAYKEWTPEKIGQFTLPTGQAALEQDPGYQFRLDQGRKALEQSGAARGLLRSGGTLKDIQDYGQKAGSQEYQNAVDRAMATAGFNANATGQNNAFGLQGYQFNADQKQQNYKNKYDAANQGYAYANQQNLAGNAQALEGYKTDVGRELGRMGINLTASQNAAVNALNSQQQQWMQVYMMNGQSFDQAYRMMMAKLQYPA